VYKNIVSDEFNGIPSILHNDILMGEEELQSIVPVEDDDGPPERCSHEALTQASSDRGKQSKHPSTSREPPADIVIVDDDDAIAKIDRRAGLVQMIAKKGNQPHNAKGEYNGFIASPNGPKAALTSEGSKVNIITKTTVLNQTTVATKEGSISSPATHPQPTILATKSSDDPSCPSVIGEGAHKTNMQAVLSQIRANKNHRSQSNQGQGNIAVDLSSSSLTSITTKQAPQGYMRALPCELGAKNSSRSASTVTAGSIPVNTPPMRGSGRRMQFDHTDTDADSLYTNDPTDHTANSAIARHSMRPNLTTSSSPISNTGLAAYTGSGTEDTRSSIFQHLNNTSSPDPIITAGIAIYTPSPMMMKKKKKTELSFVWKKLVPVAFRRSYYSPQQSSSDTDDASTHCSPSCQMKSDLQHYSHQTDAHSFVTVMESIEVSKSAVIYCIETMDSRSMRIKDIDSGSMGIENMDFGSMDSEFKEGYDELQHALQLSLHETEQMKSLSARDKGLLMSSEKMMMMKKKKKKKGVLAPQTITLAQPKKESAKRDVVFIPREVFPSMKALKSHFELKLGVQINLGNVYNDDMLEVKLRHLAGDTDALSIATAQLNHYAHNCRELEALLQELRQQNVHVYIDSSLIYEKGLEGVVADRSLRINSASLGELLINSRKCAEQVVFGTEASSSSSSPPLYSPSSSISFPLSLSSESSQWKRWQLCGFDVKLVAHDHNHSQAVMYDVMDRVIKRNVSNCRTPPHPQRTLVVVSSNNAFVMSCVLALENGWKVELWCWRGALDPSYSALHEFISSGQLRVFNLDLYRDLIFYETPV